MKDLGELEFRVMQALWAGDVAMTVRDVYEELQAERKLAYTTVMTVLDRLAKKSMVNRVLNGRAWYYRPSLSLASLVGRQMYATLRDAGPDSKGALKEFVFRLSPEELEMLKGVVSE
ncbi:MAG: CopY family transcriptional regulator [Propionibacteriales bacterium]|nr:MAG: CopY family transcriptional regulator [Propionibacteriales bacterium]